MTTRIAVGVDLVPVSRVERLLADNPAAEQDIFTPREAGYCAAKRNRPAHLAARFAAKEAVLKALGTGLGPGMRWTDVEIVNTPLGQPRVRLSGGAAERAARLGASSPEISLSHSGDYAIAHAVMFLQTTTGPDGASTDDASTDEG
ncbi:holo-[acyl-carrier-protein] synthase [Streptomyces sp. WAC05374]|uniref:holo-ACP synthase n=1 Tax=unclassified Streptomyces TaxID=2593676 RepID=UPI000F87C6AD|nr:holo-ACP synthase [Streptomyces sp. WAC05374]RST14332.1 holo-[acyl-carrier-protein] synthase [Streptomyces sp. WAC05374]TDF41120.1 holo-[acyl-carrier-protein] synthase [Streptomyces sp. WAC05374]TDF49721.1 holo-[acyl-carrier-protein] synthase [Streptomyces sp. WAC05374]TDF51390.1 holo-[acyl-carrier-protein] synthase [Streptomyces sp. WAC05374]